MSLDKSNESGGDSAKKRTVTLGVLVICLILLACAAITIAAMVSQLASARNQIATMQREAQIKALIDNLSAPSEVILCDNKTLYQVGEARRKGWERQGIKTFILYNHIAGATCTESFSSDPANWYETPIAYASSEPYENEMRSRLSWLCQRVADDLEKNQGLGAYFNDHKEDFNKRIRPLLVRLLKAADAWIVRDACKALLVAGDRSEQLVAAMRSFENTDNDFYRFAREDVRALGQKYGIDVGGNIPAKYLMRQQGLDLGKNKWLDFDPAKQVLRWAVPEKGDGPWDHMRLMIIEGNASSGPWVFDKDTTEDGQMTVSDLNSLAISPIDVFHKKYSIVLCKYGKVGKGIDWNGPAVLETPQGGFPEAMSQPSTTTQPD